MTIGHRERENPKPKEDLACFVYFCLPSPFLVHVFANVLQQHEQQPVSLSDVGRTDCRAVPLFFVTVGFVRKRQASTHEGTHARHHACNAETNEQADSKSSDHHAFTSS